MLAWLQSKSSPQDAHNTLTFEKLISNKISIFFFLFWSFSCPYSFALTILLHVIFIVAPSGCIASTCRRREEKKEITAGKVS